MPPVSHSLRVSSAFFTPSPVGFGPARLRASAAMSVHSQPRMYGEAFVSLGWCFACQSINVFMPGTFSPQYATSWMPYTPSGASRASAGVLVDAVVVDHVLRLQAELVGV